MLHVAWSVSHGASCKLHVVRCTLHVASPGYATLHASRCLPRRTRRVVRCPRSPRRLLCARRSAVRCGEPGGAERSPIACRPLRRRALPGARCLAVVSCARRRCVRRSAQLYDLTADGAEQSPISDATALATLEALPTTRERPACTMQRPQSSTQQTTCNADGVELGMLDETHRSRTVCSLPTANVQRATYDRTSIQLYRIAAPTFRRDRRPIRVQALLKAHMESTAIGAATACAARQPATYTKQRHCGVSIAACCTQHPRAKSSV
jgi:hypothetical protein